VLLETIRPFYCGWRGCRTLENVAVQGALVEDLEAKIASDSGGVLADYAAITRDAEDDPPDHRAPRRG
jgi:hypothetical protein